MLGGVLCEGNPALAPSAEAPAVRYEACAELHVPTQSLETLDEVPLNGSKMPQEGRTMEQKELPVYRASTLHHNQYFAYLFDDCSFVV